MNVELFPPKEGKSDGKIYLTNLNREEYTAAVEEIDMIIELLGRLEQSMKKEKDFKEKVEKYWRGEE